MKSVSGRPAILRKSKELRTNTNYRSIYINPGFTFAQRVQNAELRKELRRRKEGGEKVHIRRGAIVLSVNEPNFQ